MDNEKQKALGKVICRFIKEASGTPIDFEEGHCREVHCTSCMFSKLPKAIINAGFGNIEEAIKEFAQKFLNFFTDLDKTFVKGYEVTVANLDGSVECSFDNEELEEKLNEIIFDFI